eukprot:scaffold62421_cov69-Phaeocystis_antarctica.AAC.2
MRRIPSALEAACSFREEYTGLTQDALVRRGRPLINDHKNIINKNVTAHTPALPSTALTKAHYFIFTLYSTNAQRGREQVKYAQGEGRSLYNIYTTPPVDLTRHRTTEPLPVDDPEPMDCNGAAARSLPFGRLPSDLRGTGIDEDLAVLGECFAARPWLAPLVHNLNCEPSSLTISAYVFFLRFLRQSVTRRVYVSCVFLRWRVEAPGSRCSLACTNASRQRETHPSSSMMLARATARTATAKARTRHGTRHGPCSPCASRSTAVPHGTLHGKFHAKPPRKVTQAGSGKRGGGGEGGEAGTGLNGRGGVRGGMAGGSIGDGWLGKGGGCGSGGGGGSNGGGGFEGGLLRSTAQLAIPARGYDAPT